MGITGMENSKNGTPASLDDLRLFLAIGEAGSLVQASRRTGTPASTLSRRLAQLEESLGRRLVQRTSRHVALTKDGEELLARTRAHVDALDDALAGGADDEPAGPLRVTAMLATGAELVAPALMAFAKRYPRVKVELNLTNAVLPIVEEGIDIAFRSARITDGDLVARRIATWPYALVASPGVVKPRLSFGALAEVPAVLTRSNASWEFRKKDGTTMTVRPNVRFVANDPRVALEAAARGLGVVAAPLDRLGHYGKRLARIAVVGGELVCRELYAVYPSRKLVPARVRLALEWVSRAAGGTAHDG